MSVMKLEQLKSLVVEALEDLKGKDILEIDVRGKMTVTDMLIIATGTSDRHVRALADAVVAKAKQHGASVYGEERDHAWILIDLYDVLVHIMLADTREFYQLEKLWQTETPSSQNQS